MPSRLVWPLLWPLLMVAVGLVVAQGGTASAAGDRALEDAKAHFDEAQTLFVASQFSEAAAEFQKAYDAKPFPAFLFNIAVCHEKLQDFTRALEFYQQYLDKDPRSADRQTVLQRIASIRDRLVQAASTQPASRPAPDLPPTPRVKGMVVIESEPQGAAIYLNDKRRGVFARTPFHGTLPPGRYTAIIEARKFKPRSTALDVPRPDAFVKLWFGLERENYLGWIEVKTSVPGADLHIDEKQGEPLSRTPYTGYLKPGSHTLYLERRGYQPVTRVIDVPSGQERGVELKVDLQKVSFGWLRVTGATTAGARVLVDGKRVPCPRHPCQAELGPGEYQVEVQRDGWKSYRERLKIGQAAETQLLVRLMPKPPRTKAWVSFGVAGAFLTGGLVCGLLSNGAANEVKTSSDGRLVDSGDSRFFKGKMLAIGADALFGLGAITAATGIYYLFRNEGPDSYGETRTHQFAGSDFVPEPPRLRAFRLFPSVGPGSVGLTGSVEF